MDDEVKCNDMCGKQSVTISCKIGFVGAGNMARAIGEGIVRSGAVSPSQLYVSAPSERNLGSWKALGVNTSNINGYVVDNSDIVVLAMKPHLLDVAIDGIQKTISTPVEGKLFVSIIAGVTLETLAKKLKRFSSEVAQLVRVVPNTPIMVGAGCTVFCAGPDVTTKNLDAVRIIFSCGGVCEMVPESMMNAVSGLSGSGPAYVYQIIEALSDGAVKMGVPRAMATQFAAQTLLGAAKMVLDTGKHPGQLKDEVCSPGGTTIRGIHALEKAGVRCALIDAVEAATKRAEEMQSMK